MLQQVKFLAAMITIMLAVVVAAIAAATSTSDTDVSRSTQQYVTTGNRNLQVVGQIQTLRLINADTDLPIVDLFDGMIINVATQSTSNFNIQAIAANNGTIGSVKFGYNNQPTSRIESDHPYSFCGDGRPVGNYYTCTNLVVGQHNVSATPYTRTKASGSAGPINKVSFRIVNVPPTAAPTLAPTVEPSQAPVQVPKCNIPQVCLAG
jgi:hypothetical protein